MRLITEVMNAKRIAPRPAAGFPRAKVLIPKTASRPKRKNTTLRNKYGFHKRSYVLVITALRPGIPLITSRTKGKSTAKRRPITIHAIPWKMIPKITAPNENTFAPARLGEKGMKSDESTILTAVTTRP